MMMSDYLFDAGWIFFAAWSAVVALVGWIAFAGDLIPSKAHLRQEANPKSYAARKRI